VQHDDGGLTMPCRMPVGDNSRTAFCGDHRRLEPVAPPQDATPTGHKGWHSFPPPLHGPMSQAQMAASARRPFRCSYYLGESCRRARRLYSEVLLPKIQVKKRLMTNNIEHMWISCRRRQDISAGSKMNYCPVYALLGHQTASGQKRGGGSTCHMCDNTALRDN
jgi:hypothetical protein